MSLHHFGKMTSPFGPAKQNDLTSLRKSTYTATIMILKIEIIHSVSEFKKKPLRITTFTG